MISTTAVRHHYLPSRSGLRLHALEFVGNGGAASSAPPVLLLHGVTGHACLWHDVGTMLCAGRRVIAIDMRGHGDSQWSATGAYKTAQHVEDLEDVIAALDLSSGLDFAALSWGALVAMEYAARHPDMVRRFAVVDVEPSFAQSETELFPRPEWFASSAELLEWERKANVYAPPALLALHAAASVVPARNGGFVRKHDPYFFKRWPFRSDDLWLVLPTLAMPMLMLHGEHSFVRLEVMKQMAAIAAQASYEEIANSGHLIPLDAPQELAGRLQKFYDG